MLSDGSAHAGRKDMAECGNIMSQQARKQEEGNANAVGFLLPPFNSDQVSHL